MTPKGNFTHSKQIRDANHTHHLTNFQTGNATLVCLKNKPWNLEMEVWWLVPKSITAKTDRNCPPSSKAIYSPA